MLKNTCFLLLTTLLATLISVEYISNILYFIVIVIASGFVSFFIFLKLKFEIKYTIFSRLLVLSLFISYILFASIAMLERDIAYAKVSSIPKEMLKKFYQSNDINLIPIDARYTWIGCGYRKIAILPENEFGNRDTKAIGWKHNSIAAYYNIVDDRFTGSFH